MLSKKRRWHISNWIWICVTVGDRYLIIALKVTPTKCSFTDIKHFLTNWFLQTERIFQPFWLSSKSVESISKVQFFLCAWWFFLSTLFECWIDFVKWMGNNNIQLTSKLSEGKTLIYWNSWPAEVSTSRKMNRLILVSNLNVSNVQLFTDKWNLQWTFLWHGIHKNW